MDLIERYLGAVRWNLPTGKTEDIVAELRDLIRARMEDREEGLGRALTRDETSALLKEFGHPLTVAGRYHEQRALIGVEVFPFYWFVLRVVLAVTVAVEAIRFAGRLIASGAPLAQTIPQAMADAFSSLLFSAALVTFAFAVIERTGWLAAYLQKWKPESLPTLPRIQARPRRISEPILGIVFGIGFLAWWTGVLPIDWMPRESDVLVRAAPVWTVLYWPVIALIGVRILAEAASLLVPTWKAVRALLALGCAAGTVAICALLYQAGRLAIVVPLTNGYGQAARMQEGHDTALGISVPLIGAFAIWKCGVELWKLYRAPR